jgi:hypothetical protein
LGIDEHDTRVALVDGSFWQRRFFDRKEEKRQSSLARVNDQSEY